MNLQTIISIILVFSGACGLMIALLVIKRIITQLSPGKLRIRWYLLGILTLLFILGYFGYIVMIIGQMTGNTGLMVPGIFFFGACYVWLTASLSLQTTNDIRRVTLLEQETITDPLVGIYNRRYLDRRLEEEFERARRYQLPLAVLMIDIDRFKIVNDTYGHQTGDLVLNYLGKLLLEGIRRPDIAARYGGEEFLVIAPNTTISLAFTLAERLRQHIESHELNVTSEANEKVIIKITVSIGVSGVGDDTESVKQLVQIADTALYSAKKEGRNRVSLGK